MSEGSEDKDLNSKFKVKLTELEELVDKYRTRKFDEDIKALKSQFGGAEGLAEKLCSNTKDGIVPNDLDERDAAFGTNKKEKPKRTSFCKLVLIALDDLMLKVLIVAAIISIVVSMIFEEHHREIAWVEGAAILVAVGVVSNVTAFNDYSKEKEFLKLSAYNHAQKNVNVMREGKRELINFDDIKAGDLVEIQAGMSIP